MLELFTEWRVSGVKSVSRRQDAVHRLRESVVHAGVARMRRSAPLQARNLMYAACRFTASAK